jgi:hypothetical protein
MLCYRYTACGPLAKWIERFLHLADLLITLGWHGGASFEIFGELCCLVQP